MFFIQPKKYFELDRLFVIHNQLYIRTNTLDLTYIIDYLQNWDKLRFDLA